MVIYRTPVHATLITQLNARLDRIIRFTKSVFENDGQLIWHANQIRDELDEIARIGSIIKLSSFGRQETREIVTALSEMQKKHRSTFRKIGEERRKDSDFYRRAFPWVHLPTWLDKLRKEVQLPAKPLPTKPPRALAPTHDHKKTGLMFVAPARVNARDARQILESISISAREQMKLLLVIHKNKPLKIPRGDYSERNWLDAEKKFRLWYRRVNSTLPKSDISGKRYRLIENHHPTGNYLQLWETKGKMNPSYALPTKERRRKAA